MIRTAVIMAGGLGTRMRRADETVTLEAAQVAALSFGEFHRPIVTGARAPELFWSAEGRKL